MSVGVLKPESLISLNLEKFLSADAAVTGIVIIVLSRINIWIHFT
jgi:hypothetical protein